MPQLTENSMSLFLLPRGTDRRSPQSTADRTESPRPATHFPSPELNRRMARTCSQTTVLDENNGRYARFSGESLKDTTAFELDRNLPIMVSYLH